MRLSVEQIARYTHARSVVPESDQARESTSITWDSRQVVPGATYVAFPGERVDGHAFIPDALHAGAVAVLVMSDVDQGVLDLAAASNAAILRVEDTFAAFTELAACWRAEHLRDAAIIAVTGSTGKTTTKNLAASALSTERATVATKANQNNELGVPRTLLEADPETECVVVEMGMRGAGQLESLCRFVKPDYALITNIGDCHIELLGSHEAIAHAKAEAAASLGRGGVAILNAADPRTSQVLEAAQLEEHGARAVFFDGSGAADSRACAFATDIALDAQGRPSFVLCVDGQTAPCALSLRGIHNVHNACAVAALCSQLGLSLDHIVAGLQAVEPEAGRQLVLEGANGVTVIDDAYNANPDSMAASLRMFAAMDVPGSRFAVLGDMGELGDFAQAGHERVGALVAQLPIDRLVCVGELARSIAQAACDAGMDPQAVVAAASREAALEDIEPRLNPGDAVLVKASHSMEFERIVRRLTK